MLYVKRNLLYMNKFMYIPKQMSINISTEFYILGWKKSNPHHEHLVKFGKYFPATNALCSLVLW